MTPEDTVATYARAPMYAQWTHLGKYYTRSYKWESILGLLSANHLKLLWQ